MPRILGQLVVHARGRGARQAEANPVGAEVLGLGRRAQRQPVGVPALFDVRIARGEGHRHLLLGVIVTHEQHRIPPAPQILISGRVREPVAGPCRQVETHVASAVGPVRFHHLVVLGRYGNGSGRRARRDRHRPPPGAARRQESAEVRHVDRHAQILRRRRVRVQHEGAGLALGDLVPDDLPLRVQRQRRLVRRTPTHRHRRLVVGHPHLGRHHRRVRHLSVQADHLVHLVQIVVNQRHGERHAAACLASGDGAIEIRHRDVVLAL